MSNLGTSSRFGGVKPPVVRSIHKQDRYARSPSISRITIDRRQPSNYSSANKNFSYSTFDLAKKTGSCQNLASLNSQSSLDYQPRMPQLPSTNYDKINGQTRPSVVSSINKSSTTNNSFGNRDNTQAPKESSFYNGYHDQISLKPINNSYSNNKFTYSDPSSTTVSSSINGHGTAHYTTTTNLTITTKTLPASSKNSNADTNGKYNLKENGIGSCHSREESPSVMSLSIRADTSKGLNNNVNDTRGLVGLANLGNTCFMNSVLQCLSNCLALHDYCLSNKFESDLNGNSKTRGSFVKSYCEMMTAMWKTDADNYVSPDKFRRVFQRIAPSFNSSLQQDSQEFLRIMLEGLHQDVNKVPQRPKPQKVNEEEEEKLPEKELANIYWNRYIRIDNSFIVDLFVGQLKSTLLCRNCGYKSVTFDPFWDLSLPLPKNHRGNTTLTECLDLFTSEEELEGDEMPKCAKCNQKRQCSKSFSIQKFPPVLVIHLKRFSGDKYRSKISTFVEFPSTTLDLSRYAANTCAQRDVTYRLFGISNHSGTAYGGHYTAHCCHPFSRLWYQYNDTRVHRIDDSGVCSAEAYVLFYEIVR